MQEVRKIEAARLTLDILDEDPPPKGVRFPHVDDYHLIAIIRESLELSDYIKETTATVVERYKEDFKLKTESDGRIIEPAWPIQLSGAILEMGKIVPNAEKQLEIYEKNLKKHAESANFDSDTKFDEWAASVLTQSLKLIERMRLFLHSYLWMVWIIESLDQADRFGSLLKSPHRFQDHDEEVFGFIAHPPLVVATLSCTALIEEVGAEYINKLTSMSVDPEETSCSEILNKIDKEHPGLEDPEVELIKNRVQIRRNDLSHYITKRQDTISHSDFPEYCIGVFKGIIFVKKLLNELIEDAIIQNEEDWKNKNG